VTLLFNFLKEATVIHKVSSTPDKLYRGNTLAKLSFFISALVVSESGTGGFVELLQDDNKREVVRNMDTHTIKPNRFLIKIRLKVDQLK
jgi:hypothetical protein